MKRWEEIYRGKEGYVELTRPEESNAQPDQIGYSRRIDILQLILTSFFYGALLFIVLICQCHCDINFYFQRI